MILEMTISPLLVNYQGNKMTEKKEWLQVGELAEGFASDSNKLEYVNDLAGRTFDFYMENGWLIKHSFHSNNSLTWEIIGGSGTGEKSTETYTATTIRDGIYFIDFIKSTQASTSVSMVLNLNTNQGTAAINQLPSKEVTMRAAYQRVIDGDMLTPVDTVIVQFSIDCQYTTKQGHNITDELIGKRIQYTYSPHESYEHVYLNQNYYSWQCLKGVEQGLADTDFCHYYKVAKDLYLFIWREKVIPTVGVIMIDLQKLKTTGKIMGYQNTDFKELNNFPVGAYAKVLNETTHIL